MTLTYQDPNTKLDKQKESLSQIPIPQGRVLSAQTNTIYQRIRTSAELTFNKGLSSYSQCNPKSTTAHAFVANKAPEAPAEGIPGRLKLPPNLWDRDVQCRTFIVSALDDEE